MSVAISSVRLFSNLIHYARRIGGLCSDYLVQKR